MKTLDTNDWLVLNSIIYKIYTTEDEKEMRTLFLEQLKMLIDFDAADFYLAADNSESGLVDPVAYNCDCVSGEYDELDYSRGILYSGKSMVYRETDIIDDEKRKASEYYQKVYRPNNWHYSMQIILAKDKQFLGVATLSITRRCTAPSGRIILNMTIFSWWICCGIICPSASPGKDSFALRILTSGQSWEQPKNFNSPRERKWYCSVLWRESQRRRSVSSW